DAVGKGLPDAAAMQKEGERLLKAAKGANRLIALTPVGVQLTSEELAEYLERQVRVYGRVAFLVGGPLGFSDEVLVQCHEQLALSTLTLPHELARIVLLEQIYRACTILNNEQYHK
ncbi:MAG: 23S rRNA (pseudouridine(1915)-N(3))-methyltransferase RlmH, partial [Anaerolineae bacterium]